MFASLWRLGACAALALPLAVTAAAAVPPAGAAKVDVHRIVPAQPSDVAPDRIGVLVFFDFSPASRALLARVRIWGANAGSRIVLDREPLVTSSDDALARGVVVGRTLGVLDDVLPGLFDLAAQRRGDPDPKSLESVFRPWGVNPVEFTAAWNSPVADAGITRAEALAARYQVSAAPTIVVNGEWRITLAPGFTPQQAIAALNDRIAAASTTEAENQ